MRDRDNYFNCLFRVVVSNNRAKQKSVARICRKIAREINERRALPCEGRQKLEIRKSLLLQTRLSSYTLISRRAWQVRVDDVRLYSPLDPPRFPFPAIWHWTRSLISFRVECSSSSLSYVPCSCCSSFLSAI